MIKRIEEILYKGSASPQNNEVVSEACGTQDAKTKDKSINEAGKSQSEGDKCTSREIDKKKLARQKILLIAIVVAFLAYFPVFYYVLYPMHYNAYEFFQKKIKRF